MVDLLSLLGYLIWWLSFGIIHSVMALPTFKAHFPLKGQSYRVFYNIINTFTFILVILNVPSLTQIVENGFNVNLIRFIFLIVVTIFGSMLVFLGLRAWNLFELAGFQPEKNKLRTHGVFAFCRHPVYAGILLLLFNLLIIKVDNSTLSWTLGCGGYFIVGSFLEERNLNYNFKKYQEYRENVGRFIPFKVSHFLYLTKNFKSN